MGTPRPGKPPEPKHEDAWRLRYEDLISKASSLRAEADASEAEAKKIWNSQSAGWVAKGTA